MALSRDVVIRLLGESDSAVRATKAAADAADVSVQAYRRAEREQSRQAAAVESAARQQRETMADVGRGAMVFGAVVAAGLALSTRAAIDWESAWAGVQKTVDGTPEQMNELEGSLRQLATTLPATHAEIAGVAEAAGQLGVARGDIVEFTRVAIALGVSTNLSAEDAATGLARLSNIMGTSNSDVDRMGSSLVALGNAGASTEGEILDMAMRIGAAGRQAGLTEGEVLGLANAMSSLGIESEAGGTAISTVIKDVNSAVLDGGDKLNAYAEVAGMTAQQFAAAWRDDAAGALVTLVEGLGRVQASGGNVNTVISDLGLDGIRTSDTLLRLAGNTEGLADSLDMGNQAWSENNALVDEAAQRYATTASQVQMAQNQLNDAAITVGSVLLPALATGAGLIADFARGFQELPGPLQDTVVIVGAAAAGVALIGGAALIAIPKVMAFRLAMLEMATAAGASGAAGMMGRLGLFMTGPWGAALGVATIALGGLVTMLGNSSKSSQAAASYTDSLASAFRESSGAIDDNVQALARQQAADTKIGDSNLLNLAARAGVAIPRLTEALLGNRAAYDDVRAALQRYQDQAAQEAGAAITSEDTTNYQAALDALDDLAPSAALAQETNRNLAETTEGTNTALGGQADAASGAADATGELGEQAKTAAEMADLLADALDNLNGPTLDLRDAQREFQDAIDSVQERIDGAAEGLEGFGRTLDINTEAGRENAASLDSMAERAMNMANAVYNTTGSYDDFRANLEGARQDLFNQARQFHDTDEAAWAYVDSVLAIPTEVQTAVGTPGLDTSQGGMELLGLTVLGVPDAKTVVVSAPTAEQRQRLADLGYLVRTLPDGNIEVYADVSAAQTAINNLVNQRRTTYVNVVESYSGRSASTQADFRALGGEIGGIVRAYALGGIEPMSGAIAQIVAPGRKRIIGDRVVNDEFFIPDNDEPRSLAIGEEWMRRRGYPVPGDGSAMYAQAMPAQSVGGSSASSGVGATVIDIDYGRLASAVASVLTLVHVDQMVMPPDTTVRDLAEQLTWDARTGG